MRGAPVCALDDEISTIRPHRAAIMSGMADCTQWKVPVRFTASILFHWSIVRSVNFTNAEMPALVKVVPDQAVVAMALIENIQRENLSPLEEAQALSRLIDEFHLTQQETADAVGRSRPAVSNLLRLLELPAEIKRLLDERKLDMGHARALATLPEARATALALEAAEQGWSVRELEEAARRAEAPPKGKAKKPGPRDPNIAALERDLAEKLAARVFIAHAKSGRGKLVIHYHSIDELDGILERFH